MDDRRKWKWSQLPHQRWCRGRGAQNSKVSAPVEVSLHTSSTYHLQLGLFSCSFTGATRVHRALHLYVVSLLVIVFNSSLLITRRTVEGCAVWNGKLKAHCSHLIHQDSNPGHPGLQGNQYLIQVKDVCFGNLCVIPLINLLLQGARMTACWSRFRSQRCRMVWLHQSPRWVAAIPNLIPLIDQVFEHDQRVLFQVISFSSFFCCSFCYLTAQSHHRYSQVVRH